MQYHPNEVRLTEAEKQLNVKNLALLHSQPARDSFQFVVVGDSQRFYDELQGFVSTINRLPAVSFVVINGDISDFGLNREFKWISRELSKLEVPFITVIGNHDMLSNGRLIYKEMFGAENFSFQHHGYKFIALNSNSREVGFNGTIPDISWLQSELATATAKVFVFAHVSPFSPDFDPKLTNPYTVALASGSVLFSIHGHDHNFLLTQPSGQQVQYVVAPSVKKKSFALFKVGLSTTTVEEILY